MLVAAVFPHFGEVAAQVRNRKTKYQNLQHMDKNVEVLYAGASGTAVLNEYLLFSLI